MNHPIAFERAASLLRIDVFFDFVCPWCLIGKRQLDNALAEFARLRPDVTTSIQWIAYPLVPDVPTDGLPFTEFYNRRLGGEVAVALRQAQVRAAASAVGVEIAFEDIDVFPSTLAAHRLLAAVKQAGLSASHLIDALFESYFQRGEDIGERSVLTRAGLHAGLNDQQCLAALTSNDAFDATLLQRREQWHRNGVQGVPHFVFNETVVTGAPRGGVLLNAMLHAVGASQPA